MLSLAILSLLPVFGAALPTAITSAINGVTSEAGGLTSAAGALPSQAQSAFSSVTGEIASALPTAILTIPDINSIDKELGLNETALGSLPTSALMVPSYSNWTGQSWNVRFYGFVYKLNQTANYTDTISKFLDLTGDNLNSTEQMLLQNRTTDLASFPLANANISVSVSVNGSSVGQPIALSPSDSFGELDEFHAVPGLPSNSSKNVQVVQLYAQNVTGPGNSTTLLVPTQGISVISDIDDVLRVTKVYVPQEGLKNSFVEPYVNYADTPQVFAEWKQTLPGVAFHYDTTTPLELTRTYVEYLFDNYPLGSLEMRPVNLSDPSQILDARKQSLIKLFQTFPQRKFVLVGDSSSSSLLTAYPQVASMFPNQLSCIFIRNTSATDSDDKLPYSTSEFKSVNASQVFFYVEPTNLLGLDIANGQCINSTIPQNITYSEQGGPFRF